ncbi:MULTISPECIES: carbohydrate ABC transporter permease [Rossellomorea]|jgi:lactose/L-arabinose transport system permease protein|uniref:Lactose ABC transporter permease n=1 Tax=Rossellomorea marisflavi TaxID=189381 RepID=A0A0J5TEL5_9BACI|nr:sugar ABC transporter permease [Rossellomorea marisflavi]KQU57556.1 lactose ABC transporter permease [Bacillus sp. Leaf406]MBV6684051.1 sugar ABC transporter permease [Bacillus sp. JRC01]VXC14176.1 Lactose transport system permease protein LacF [Bacillus sp. 349Y]KMK92949.1 lactose ABC transporter permease [Rossellomorea marisflavi]KML05583.1 lactose ABC transporter permease [Rossellomorea marisflavi]
MKTKAYIPYLFVAPALVLFSVFMLYPIISSLIMSFQSGQGANLAFVGIDNYKRLMSDEIFHKALKNTFILLIIQVPIMVLLALILSSILNSALLRMKGFFRVTFFLPAVTSLVAYSIIFSIMLMNDGVINQVLAAVGLDAIPWLNDPFWAKASLILAMTWRWVGYNMVIYLAGLQNIPEEMYEAASMDGASKVRQFFSITIPQLKPVILFTVVLSTIGTLQLFDEPFVLTKGGPSDATLTIGMYLYQTGFRYFDFGYASTIAYVIVVLIAIMTFIQFKVTGDQE